MQPAGLISQIGRTPALAGTTSGFFILLATMFGSTSINRDDYGWLVNSTLDTVYQCLLNYAEIPGIGINITVHHLLNDTHGLGLPISERLNASINIEPAFEEIERTISRGDLARSTLLDPDLPFVIFVNGFNGESENPGPFEVLWTYETSRMLTRYNRDRAPNITEPVRTNTLLVTWEIPNLLVVGYGPSIIPAYYKTIAHFERIVGRLARIFGRLIEFAKRKGKSREQLMQQFAQSRVYGHSLGAHLVSRVVSLLRRRYPEIRFGKLVGLDPAKPCFVSEKFGISADQVEESVNELALVHSNGGFTGISAAPGRNNIMLNGGSFQPNCSSLGFFCNHYRATDIMGYLDDSCQLVAYECDSYSQFKLGACETCDRGSYNRPLVMSAAARLSQPMDDGSGCILATMEEQVDGANFEFLRSQLDQQGVPYSRRLANGTGLHRPTGSPARSKGTTTRGRIFYANTNANHNKEGQSHCLQHYQARLLLLPQNTRASRNLAKCPAGKYLKKDATSIELRLVPDNLDGGRAPIASCSKETARCLNLTDINNGTLFTGLINFAAKPEIYSTAKLANIDLASWSKCLGSSTSRINLVLDLAFMSHRERSVRHAYSSLLCGRLNPESGKLIRLELCSNTDMGKMGEQIDGLISNIQFETTFESWQVNLLNNLLWILTPDRPIRVTGENS